MKRLLFGLSIILLFSVIALAGDLEPPGPPGSTMHTLDEIYDAVTNICLGGPALVEKSGQETSYELGDDGFFERGVAWPGPRFTDNGDDTVTDNLTGLMWMKDASALGFTHWTDAIARCELCRIGGYEDWHLPQVKELMSLIDYEYWAYAIPNTAGTGQWTQGDPFIDVNLFIDTLGYWSSTTYVATTTYAWVVDPVYGRLTFGTKSIPEGHVWCVRGGPNL